MNTHHSIYNRWVGALDGIVAGIGSSRESGKMKIDEARHITPQPIHSLDFSDNYDSTTLREIPYSSRRIEIGVEPLLHIHQISRTHTFESANFERFQHNNTPPASPALDFLTNQRYRRYWCFAQSLTPDVWEIGCLMCYGYRSNLEENMMNRGLSSLCKKNWILFNRQITAIRFIHQIYTNNVRYRNSIREDVNSHTH